MIVADPLLSLTPSGNESFIILIINRSSTSDILSSIIGIGLSGVAQVSPGGNTYSYVSGG